MAKPEKQVVVDVPDTPAMPAEVVTPEEAKFEALPNAAKADPIITEDADGVTYITLS